MIKLFNKACTFVMLPCFAIAACLVDAPIWGVDQHQIHHVDQQISAEKLRLKTDQGKRKELTKLLQSIEERISNITQQKNKLKKQIKNQTKSINKLNHKILPIQKDLLYNKILLSDVLQAYYKLNNKSFLHIMFSNQDSSSRQRFLTYFKYLNTAQLKILHSLNLQFHNLGTLQENQEVRQQTLRSINKKLKSTQDILNQSFALRTQIIHRINAHIQSRQQKLASLTSQKQALLVALNKAKAQTVSLNYSFARLKGTLSWPTRGHIIQSFGLRIDQSQLKTDGVVIKAPEGQAVKAIAAGKVVFSKWLAGYGLLLILDHGHGYMSLYGRNGKLFYHTGQTVKKGTTIGSVGETGGFAQSSLYFAIRKNNQAINPKLWCRT